MKRLIAPLLLLAIMIGLCAFSTWQVGRICRATAGKLEQAETRCALGDFQGAEEMVLEAQRMWERHEGFLGTALRHTESDDIDILFPPLLESCRQEDPAEFSHQNRELVATLQQIARMEIPYYFNVLFVKKALPHPGRVPRITGP